MSVPRVFVVTGPSGVGKRTVIEGARAVLPNNQLSISYTTRERRPGEVHGVDYFFVTRDAFSDLLARGQLLEHTEYVGNFYGTPVSQVEDARVAGNNLFIEIEVAGAQQIRQKMPNVLTVFIMPPEPWLGTLERRLRERGTETEERIASRLRRAVVEMGQRSEFDHVIVNSSRPIGIAHMRAFVKGTLRSKRAA